MKKVQLEKNVEVLPRSAMLRQRCWNNLRYIFYTYFSALQPAIISCKCCRWCVCQYYTVHVLCINMIFQYYSEWYCGAFISIYSVFCVRCTYLLQPKPYLSDMPSIRRQVDSYITSYKKLLLKCAYLSFIRY